MEIESAGSKVEVVGSERNRDVKEGGQLNAVRVRLGLAGKGKSPATRRVSRPSSGLSGMGEIGRGNATKVKA
jgi:hypothetical protein